MQIRLPDGTRKARRFKRTDPLQAIFDFIDIGEGASQPGSYNLINSYPRKAFSDGMSVSLEDAGITSDTALFIEPR